MNKIDRFAGAYGFLSNFHQSSRALVIGGKAFMTAEHAYQWFKPTDPKVQQAVLAAPSPGEAKRIANGYARRADWGLIKIPIMHMVIAAKFSYPELRARLLDTIGCELIEGNNWHDNFWGICGCKICPGLGGNYLGRILMHYRKLISGVVR